MYACFHKRVTGVRNIFAPPPYLASPMWDACGARSVCGLPEHSPTRRPLVAVVADFGCTPLPPKPRPWPPPPQAYQRHRGLPQEAAYNLGRAAHQLGLLHVALHWYTAALEAAPAVAPGDGGRPAGRWDLRREVAHNLVALYRSSGAVGLAREVMERYLVV